MRLTKHRVMKALVPATALLAVLASGTLPLRAASRPAIFVIALENHNWEQPVNKFTGTQQQIYRNPAAPYLTSLVDGTSNISDQVSFAKNYFHVLATQAGAKFSIHPSEPNYLWAEAGTNFGILNDNDPFTNGPAFPNNHDTTDHLSGLLAANGYTWKSYQEDVDLVPTPPGLVNRPSMATGGLSNTTAGPSQWTVPLISFSGTFVSPGVNAYNRKNQYNYAAKHTPQAFFTDTNGGNNPTNTNPQSLNYAPLQQLLLDLPLQHGGGLQLDHAEPVQRHAHRGDRHLHGAGWKAVHGRSGQGSAGRRFPGADHSARSWRPTRTRTTASSSSGRTRRKPPARATRPRRTTSSTRSLRSSSPRMPTQTCRTARATWCRTRARSCITHSSDLRTLQEIFGVGTAIRDAANANDLSDLFKPGVISHPNVHGNLTISAGQSVTFSQGVVTGNIKVNGGTLFLSNGSYVGGNIQVSSGNVSIANSTVDGNVQFVGGGSFAIGAGAVINGNLQIQNLPASTKPQTVCGATVGGNLALQNSAAPVAFGAVDVVGTSVACGNMIGGNMQIQDNTAPVQLFNNTVRKNLICQQNSAIDWQWQHREVEAGSVLGVLTRWSGPEAPCIGPDRSAADRTGRSVFDGRCGHGQFAEDPVGLSLWSRREIQRVGVAQADAVPEDQPPDAFDVDRVFRRDPEGRR